MSRFSSRNSSLLKDNSWIRKYDDEDEDIDRDPNFGKSVLSHTRTSEDPAGSESEEIKTSTTTRRSTSVHDLTKRFSGSQDDLKSSTLPSSRTSSSYTKSTYSTVKSDSPDSTTNFVLNFTEEPKTSTKTTTVTQDGKTTETTITTTQSVRSPVIKSPTKTETFTERVKSSSKGPLYSNYSPTRTTKVTETSITSSKDAEDKLYDTLIPSTIKNDFSPTDSAEDKLYDTLIPSTIKNDFSPTDSKTTFSNTETVTVKSSSNGNGIKTTTTTRTSSSAEDDLYDTLLPKAITSVSSLSSPVSSSITKREIITVESSRGGESPTLSSPSSTRRTTSYSSYTDDLPSTHTTSFTISTTPSDDYNGERKRYSYSRPDSSYEYSSVTSPTVYTKSYRTSSRSDDVLTDSTYSSSIKNVYASPERTVLEKDLCSYCRKPFTGDAKMVLDDMKINCHASCFKCEVCKSTLGDMRAGDSLWIYKCMVYCENCFVVTRDKWRR